MAHAPRSSAAFPCASDDGAVSSTPRGTLPSGPPPAYPFAASASRTLATAGGDVEKGKRKVDDFTVTGVVRPLAGPSPATEVAPPLSRLLAMNAAARGIGERRAGLDAWAGPGLEAMADELRRKEAALAVLRSQLQQLRSERGECSYKNLKGKLPQRRPEDEANWPQKAAAGGEDIGAALERLQLMMAMLHETMADCQRKVALTKEEEMQLTPGALKARGEFLKVRENKKIRNTWIKRQIALASGLRLLIQFRTSLPPRYLSHIAGVLAVLWILGSIALFRHLFETSKTVKSFRRHVACLIYICLSLFVLYIFYLISQPVGGTFSGFLGNH